MKKQNFNQRHPSVDLAQCDWGFKSGQVNLDIEDRVIITMTHHVVLPGCISIGIY